jgi:hypothetical protein
MEPSSALIKRQIIHETELSDACSGHDYRTPNGLSALHLINLEQFINQREGSVGHVARIQMKTTTYEVSVRISGEGRTITVTEG